MEKNKKKCPKCEDFNIYMLGFDLYECANCGHQWKDE
jgi:ribosomal protein L37AE/L43A